MSSWWDSVDFLTRINFWVQLGLAFFGVLTAVAILSTVFVAKRISDLQNIEAERARSKQAEAEKALAELQKRVPPRSLTNEQHEKIVGMLRAAPQEHGVALICGDTEGCGFASEVTRVLHAAGWPAAVNQDVTMSGHIVGVALVVRDPSKLPPRAGILLAAFTSAGFPLQVTALPTTSDDAVFLVVGRKP